MNSLHRTEGFVFLIKDQNEADRAFSVFTKDFGRISVFGKSIKKINSKLGSNIEPLSFCQIEFIEGRRKKTLKDAFFTEKFRYLKQNPLKIQTAFAVADVLDNLIKGEEQQEEIFNLIGETFARLADSPAEKWFCELLYIYFFWNLVSILGYGPELYNCVACKKKLNEKSLYFSNGDGGFVCCYSDKKELFLVNADAVKALRLILQKNWSILSKLKINNQLGNSLKELSGNYYLYLANQ